jgi:hypothetical protein
MQIKIIVAPQSHIESLLYPIPFLYDPKTIFEVVKWYGVVIVIV